MTAIPCPGCGEPLDGAACPACGGRAVIALKPDEDAPACSGHPGRKASAPCSRCGRFCCAVCLLGANDGLLCRACRPKPEGVPWEGPGFPWFPAYLRTAWGFIAAPGELAVRLEAGRGVWRAILFAVLSIVLGSATVFGLVYAAVAPEQRRFLAEFIGPFDLAASFVWLVALPFSDWLGFRVAGAPIRFGECFKAAAYATAPLVLGIIPFVGCSLSAVWCVVLRLVLLRAITAAGWRPILTGALFVPGLLASAAIAFRWDIALR